MKKLIDKLRLPEELRALDEAGLTQVAGELRDELIDTVSRLGGHFASSLGATEITVALHHLFDTPNDRLVWDVGHQGYIHKMLTGRRSGIPKIKQRGGPSGFLKRSESEYDTFGAGHAGTSISAAVGMATALNKTHPDRYTVAVIGDGSLTAGMAFEALNHAGALGLKNFIVVLNDNQMSISPNVGAISWLFSKAITSRTSTFARKQFKNLYRKGYVPEIVYKLIDRAEEAAQGFFHGPAMLFEAFGFRYIGPVDGHNMPELLQALKNAKDQDVPVVVHAYTVKGKGYEPAEEDPIKWHAVTPFDRSRGEFLGSMAPVKLPPPTYTAVFADTLIELAKRNSKIVAITAAMAGGTGLDKFEKELPEQFFDVGICEQHAVTMAAGLACEGYIPFCTIYSTFLQRAFDQVAHDVCIQNLPVIFPMDRGGVVGNDGETHQGVFDIGYLRILPNIVIMSPKDENEFRHMLFTASTHTGPIAIRYPRGNAVGVPCDTEFKQLEIGKAEIVREGTDVLLVCFGPLVTQGLSVAQKLSAEGLSVAVINARFAKPLDEELLARELPKYSLVCTLEDHALMGGFGSAVLEFVHDQEIAMKAPLKRFGVRDHFVPHMSQADQHQLHGYDAESILAFIRERISPRRLASVG